MQNTRHRVNSQQYEELCRYFLAEKLGTSVEKIKSIRIPNPTRPGLPEYQHQVDLYWEIESELGTYLHIANAKWRGNNKVDQQEVMLLQQVKQKIAAHKALMLTNQGYTAGAIAVAKDEGIALHIVKPNIDLSILPTQGQNSIQAKLHEVASTSSQPVFLHEVVHKAFDFREVSIQNRLSSSISRSSSYQTKIISGYETKVGGGYSHKASTQSGSRGSVKTHSGAPVTKSGGPSKTK